MFTQYNQLGNSYDHNNVLLCILCASTSFKSLFATVRASKAVYNVYTKNAEKVLSTVAVNLVGPAYPLAIQLVRLELEENNSTVQSKEEGDSPLKLAVREVCSLADKAQLVREWEDLFSWRMKNFRSTTTQLTQVESWRFQKAMYRLMLYSRLFPKDKSAYNIKHDSSGQPYPNFYSAPQPHSLTSLFPELTKELTRRKEFLSEIFSNELRQLRFVTDFVIQIIRWVDSVDGYHMKGVRDYIDIALSAGPAVILECYKTLGFEPLTEAINRLCPETTPEYFEDTQMRPLLSGYIIHLIDEILRDRDTDGGFYDDGNGVLESEPNMYEPCAKCNNQIYMMGLWGKTTWDYLSLPSQTLGTYIFPSTATFLKGELPRNPVEIKRVEALLVKTPLKNILQDISTRGLKLSAYPDLNDNYWCQSCVTMFIKDHLHLWVIMKRKEANEKLPNDCWYGYNCRTQVHKSSHAEALNHL
ncbi:hypothetical protein GYMLUDRAFT_523134 [Collybiopsis luxurians FD-317 M1]|nr:hypothetical protein GYMLUDRAFT_523134 [Collybiopsis luxurians FD-317 M1]